MGDSFAFGRQYDPKETVACAHYYNKDNGKDVWYDQPCFDVGRLAAACDAMATDAAIQGCEEDVMAGCVKSCDEARQF